MPGRIGCLKERESLELESLVQHCDHVRTKAPTCEEWQSHSQLATCGWASVTRKAIRPRSPMKSSSIIWELIQIAISCSAVEPKNSSMVEHWHAECSSAAVRGKTRSRISALARWSRQLFLSLPTWFRACALNGRPAVRGKQRSVVGRRDCGRLLRNERAASSDLARQRPSPSNVSVFSVVRCADGAVSVC